MNKRWMVTGVLSLAAAAVLWAQGVVVCKSCGREAKPGDAVCAHCAAPLPKPQASGEAAPKPAAPAVDKDAEVGRGAAEVVEECVRQARELEKGPQPAVALCYYQNALALMRLVPAGKFPESVGAAIPL